MPPVRTSSIPATIKPVKTERTHEENQERAYIAASRRSDRSLEARVESARRASDIHKKRTGRGLRVTEKDVMNEEMYEEEDDNLPAQYRRLTAHLQTHSLDFNRRLQAYIQSHAGTRNAMAAHNGASFANAFPMQFPNAAQINYQMMQPIAPPQVLPPQMYQQQQQQQPQNYRHAPYPMPPSNTSFRPSPHHRSASIATTQEASYQSHYQPTGGPETPRPDELRRNSMPPKVFSPGTETDDPTRPNASRTSTNIHNLKLSSTPAFNPTQDVSTPSYANLQHEAHMSGSQQMPYMGGMPPGFNPASQHINMNPFEPLSMALPTESQQFLGNGFGMDPYSAMLMNGSQHLSQPFYSYNPNPSSKSSPSAAANAGINQTLAPSYNDSSQTSAVNDPYSSTVVKNEAVDTPFDANYGFGLDGNFSENQSTNMTRVNSAQGSAGAVTPGEWNSFIEQSAWETPSQ
ncbi:uncharacterized protein BDZ99DRAFT_228981 [Mytilinidion resinicola]|uniref:Uncharacterized protein n=1 Tax=Mytilinidion resinicola TaxID=574789 RepID=A0A6A6Z102_9PEZI|nr:uncharacterized protein BDZ99DRAFT_228981 [Mytilinidion resinicola]KAF2813954.1 hypothetical protein BDZ99DRAFT_228981 [Mytilinidion resinicola]